MQITPLLVVLLLFLVVPILTIVSRQLLGLNEFTFYPDFTFDNYAYLLTSGVTWRHLSEDVEISSSLSWLSSRSSSASPSPISWPSTSARLTWQIALFLLCTVPFWTSNIIRMISWIPFLGRNGLANQALIGMGLIDEPLEWLLFSDFAVILAFVHLYTLFMVVPIFNTMMRIDKSLIEAARDAGASGLQILRNVIIPLSKPGIMIGSIFVVTLVMGDFITVRFMSGGAERLGRADDLQRDRRCCNIRRPRPTPSSCSLTVLHHDRGHAALVDIRKEL